MALDPVAALTEALCVEYARQVKQTLVEYAIELAGGIRDFLTTTDVSCWKLETSDTTGRQSLVRTTQLCTGGPLVSMYAGTRLDFYSGVANLLRDHFGPRYAFTISSDGTLWARFFPAQATQ